MSTYDVFISYRRDGGEQSAKSIYDRLKEQGYKVFLDIETLRSGAFNEKLYKVIDECQDVLVILSPNALDRCHNEDDWVRLEIVHALKSGKNVIPIMLRGFSFPADLPQDMESLPFQNGVQASVEFFDAFMGKLYQFLKSKLILRRRFYNNLSWRRSVIAVITSLLIVVGIWGASVILKQKSVESGSYPITKEDKNEVNQMLFFLEANIATIDNMYLTMEGAYDACKNYLLKKSGSGYSELVATLNHTLETLTSQSSQGQALSSDLLTALADTQINTGDLTAITTIPGDLLESYKPTLSFLLFAMNPENIFDDVSRNKIVEINQELNQVQSDLLFVNLNQLMLPVDDEALKDFRLDFLPTTYVLSNKLDKWTRDEVRLKSQEEAAYTQQEKLLNEYAQIVGDNNVDFMSEKQVLIDMLIAGGLSKEEAEAHVESTLDKTQAIRNDQEKLDQLNAELQEGKERIREKFAPVETDDPYYVWAKGLRFLYANMPEDAIKAFQFHMMQLKDSDENVLVYVPAAIRFVNQMGQTGVDYGVMVIGYEQVDAPHKEYKIGDIVIAVNQVPTEHFTGYQNEVSKIPKGESYVSTILRADENGQLQVIDVTIIPGQTRVALLDMAEEE